MVKKQTETIYFNKYYHKYTKRLFDIVFSLVFLIILSPILVLIAILIRLTLGSPILFKQKRPGLNGQIFFIYKFRTMSNAKDECGELLPDKDRITKLGKFLRTTSLDELPELINILKGEMSFVGPRPLSVKYLPFYNAIEKQRHNVRPGLTGLAQINGRNVANWDERFQYDIEYLKSSSLIMDLKIIIKTFIVVLKREDIVLRGTGEVMDFQDYRKKQLENPNKNTN